VEFIKRMNKSTDSQLIELYSSTHGIVFQCDRTHKIIVNFGGSSTSFKIQNFLNFKKMVDSVDIHSMIFNLSDDFDYGLIDAPNADTRYRLTLCEILHLRELLEGARFALYVKQTISEIFEELV
jgi:hypothetical protein